MKTISNSKAVNLVIMFGFNYPQGFIYKVWDGDLANHLQSKFNGHYSTYGSRAVFQMFYANLSQGNQDKLVAWILENYKG